MKYPSAKNNYYTAIQIGLLGAIASSISLALPSPTKADTPSTPAATAENSPTPATAALLLTPHSAPQGMASPEAAITPEQLAPAAVSGVNSSTGNASTGSVSAPQMLTLPETSTSINFSSTEDESITETVQDRTPATPVANSGSDPALATPESSVEAAPEAAPEAVPEAASEAASEAPSVSVPVPADSVSPSSPSTVVRVLSPTADTVLDVPATTVILQFPVGSTVTLQVDGETVDSSLIGRTETDPNTNLVTQTWYGVGLREGRNTITVQSTANGAPVSLEVVVRGAPSQLTIEPVEAAIPADGRSTATIQGELLDENGTRSNRDAVVTLEASQGEFTGADASTDQPGFQVQARQGQYTATLRSSLNAGVVRVRATTGELEAFNQIEFTTSLHPTLISGVVNLRFGARGTNFFDSFRDFLPPDGDNGAQLDLNGAVFATTPIGEWQFTGAYNSDRPLNRDCDGNNALFRETQDCEETYPVYGDSSTSDVVAPSTDQVYLRLERTSPVRGAGSDFLMWGDYSTADQFANPSQLYTATNRVLHGLYGNYNLGNLQVTGFYGNNVQGFQRDTIAPDGTSGYYFLSQRLLVPGSENVFIETEEFNRPGTVIESEPQSRGVDYQIDYDRGTVLFNQPILRTDVDDQGRVLVRRIVVTYQYDSHENANIYGGRLQYNLSRELNQESWIGADYIQENQGDRHFELYGADALIPFGQDSQLVAEYAYSQNSSDLRGDVGGSAYRLEASTTLFEGIQGRAYYRSTDAGFSNNATTSFVPGQTRYGAELQSRLSQTTTLHANYDHEDNFGTAPRQLDDLFDLLNPGSEPIPGSRVDNSLTTLSLGVEQQIGQATLGVDWIHRDRQDRIDPDALTETSDQLRSRFTMPIARNFTFRAQNELNLGGSDPLYPNRTILGVDWQAYPGITVSLNQQFFSSQELGDNAITSLDVSGDYHPWTNATARGRFSLIGGHGMSGAIGLQQGVTIAPGLRATVAYEHIFASEFNYTGAGAQFPQPYAVGQSASALGIENGDSYSVGLEYTDNPDFQANARFEHRTSSEGDNTVITAAALGRVTPTLTALVNFQQASASNQRLAGLGSSSTLRLGLAYRDPNSDQFNALLRYEYRRNPSTIPDSLLFSSGTGSEEHLLAVEAIYALNWRWEFYGKVALRHSTSYLASDLIGSSTVTLTQARATYRLGYRWDLAAEARWISQPSANYTETGLSLEAGYYLTPNLRLSAGYSLGRVSDRDFNGDRSASGPYLGITLKLDNNLFRDFGIHEVSPPQQQESVVTPVAADSTAPLTLAPLDAASDSSTSGSEF